MALRGVSLKQPILWTESKYDKRNEFKPTKHQARGRHRQTRNRHTTGTRFATQASYMYVADGVSWKVKSNILIIRNLSLFSQIKIITISLCVII